MESMSFFFRGSFGCIRQKRAVIFEKKYQRKPPPASTLVKPVANKVMPVITLQNTQNIIRGIGQQSVMDVDEISQPYLYI